MLRFHAHRNVAVLDSLQYRARCTRRATYGSGLGPAEPAHYNAYAPHRIGEAPQTPKDRRAGNVSAPGGVRRVGMDTLLVISLLVGAGTAWSQVQSPRSEERGRDRASDPITSEAMRSDAELTDVCFVDRKTGWAVGDRGVIWHTADGGKDWEIQPSGVSCRLESVSFISPEVGWAVGWTAHPYSQAGPECCCGPGTAGGSGTRIAS